MKGDCKNYKCNLCGRSIENHNDQCKFCGWVQQIDLDNPDKIHWTYNFVSYNKAKELLSEGKPLIPDFNDFLECMKVYSELEFFINEKHYGIITNKDNTIHFYEWNEIDKGYQIYPNIIAFADNANINGILLRSIWNQVYKVGVAS